MTTPFQRTMPVYHFHERHSRLITAPPAVVLAILEGVGRSGPGLCAPPDVHPDQIAPCIAALMSN
jgi:hypothetical protein